MKILGLLKYPVVRHILAGLIIVVLLWMFSIAPLQIQNKSLQKELRDVRVQQIALIKELAQKDTYSIQNSVDGAKIKKGGEIKLIPDNNMNIEDTSTVSSTISEGKESTRVGRFFKGIGKIFKKKK